MEGASSMPDDSSIAFGTFLDGATIASITRRQTMADNWGFAYRVAMVAGTAADGTDWIAAIDETLIVVAPERLHPLLREALVTDARP